MVEATVSEGAKAIFLELEVGEYRMGEKTFQVKASSMLPMNFVSRKTGHPLVEGFQEFDFRNWYDRKLGRISPILEATFTGNQITPVLLSGNTDKNANWGKAMAAGEFFMGRGL